MTGSRPGLNRVASHLSGAARVAVGVLWLIEGFIKYRAGFGAADIMLVVDSTAGNSRTPWWFVPVGAFMEAAPGLFGVVMPALEMLLGILLIAGVFTRLVAFASIGTLMLYSGADQLVAQFPAMVVLSALVLLLPGSGRYGIDGWRARSSRAISEATPVGTA